MTRADWNLSLIVVIAVGVAVVEPSAVSADGTTAEASDGSVLDADALGTDARMIAPSLGWTAAYAVERLVHQERFASYLGTLAEEYPDSFAGGYTKNEARATSWVLFKGSTPAEAIRLAVEQGIDASFVGDAKYSLAELQGLASAVQADLTNSGIEAGVGYSIERQRIDVAVVRMPEWSSMSDEDLSTILPAVVRGPGISIRFIDGPLVIEAHSYGGDRLLDDGVFECTSGYTVSNGSMRGVVTAAHCLGLNQYKQNNGVTYGMSFQAQHEGAWGDIEWHTTSHDEYAEFYVSASTRRTVQSVQPAYWFFPGQLYCGFGRATNGSACAEVQYGEFDCGSSKGNQVIMSLDGQVGELHLGDSGGPWYISNTAAGVFMGWCVLPEDGLAHLSFTKMDYSDDALGVTIVFAP